MSQLREIFCHWRDDEEHYNDAPEAMRLAAFMRPFEMVRRLAIEIMRIYTPATIITHMLPIIVKSESMTCLHRWWAILMRRRKKSTTMPIWCFHHAINNDILQWRGAKAGRRAANREPIAYISYASSYDANWLCIVCRAMRRDNVTSRLGQIASYDN